MIAALFLRPFTLPLSRNQHPHKLTRQPLHHFQTRIMVRINLRDRQPPNLLTPQKDLQRPHHLLKAHPSEIRQVRQRKHLRINGVDIQMHHNDIDPLLEILQGLPGALLRLARYRRRADDLIVVVEEIRKVLGLVAREGHVDAEQDRVGGVAEGFARGAGELLHARQRAGGADQMCHGHGGEDAGGVGVGGGGEIGVGVDVDEADAQRRTLCVRVLPEGGEDAWQHAALAAEDELERGLGD